MRSILLVVLFAALILPTVSAQGTKDDNDLIQGNWQLVSEMERGKDVTDKSVTVTMTLKNGAITIKSDTGDKMQGTYNINTTKNPRWINVTYEGQTTLAIYELKGNMLTLCHGNTDDLRPTMFASEATSASKFLAVFKRVK
jgi:uncharacterized protein (TIGR03067 family)